MLNESGIDLVDLLQVFAGKGKKESEVGFINRFFGPVGCLFSLTCSSASRTPMASSCGHRRGRRQHAIAWS